MIFKISNDFERKLFLMCNDVRIGDSALIIAAKENNQPIVEVLVEAEANVDLQDK